MTANSDKAKWWIEAAKSLTADRAADVLCPECGRGHMKISDIFSENKLVEQRIWCPSCGAEIFLRISLGGSQGQKLH
jgi:predicted RNA-binding Zn-ribbon protein involved in translation (DUF1610 family)